MLQGLLCLGFGASRSCRLFLKCITYHTLADDTYFTYILTYVRKYVPTSWLVATQCLRENIYSASSYLLLKTFVSKNLQNIYLGTNFRYYLLFRRAVAQLQCSNLSYLCFVAFFFCMFQVSYSNTPFSVRYFI